MDTQKVLHDSRYIEEVLISEEQLRECVSRLAGEIDRDYAGRRLLVVGILKGAFMFFTDLVRALDMPVEIDFMKASSYGSGSRSSGKINVTLDLNRSDFGELDVLIVEDIVDSGRTLSLLTEYLKKKGVRSVATCALLSKPERREVEFEPDYVGFVIPDKFVIGYGLDYAEQYRTLPYVGVLAPEAYMGK